MWLLRNDQVTGKGNRTYGSAPDSEESENAAEYEAGMRSENLLPLDYRGSTELIVRRRVALSQVEDDI
jgi:hypothetical protein